MESKCSTIFVHYYIPKDAYLQLFVSFVICAGGLMAKTSAFH